MRTSKMSDEEREQRKNSALDNAKRLKEADAQHFNKVGKQGGDKTLDKHGVEHFREMGRKSREKAKERQEQTGLGEEPRKHHII